MKRKSDRGLTFGVFLYDGWNEQKIIWDGAT